MVSQPLGLPLTIVGALMFGLWTFAYIAIIRKAYKDKTYGIPIVDGCLNVSWEFVFSFGLAGHLSNGLEWGNRFWLLFDALSVTTYFLYGRKEQTIPWVKKHYFVILIASLVFCGVGQYQFMLYFQDDYGVVSSLLMDVLMAALFIALFFKRPDMRGLSYAGAWLMMLGNIFGFIFIHFWFPTQYVDGHMIAHPEWPEPKSFHFLTTLYVATSVMNAIYVYLMWNRRRELNASAKA
jgi:hypothetical protein